MSVLGIDVSTLPSKIGVARNRGIGTILNEVSIVLLPANTISPLRRIIGRIISDPDLENEKKYLNAMLVDVNGTVAQRYGILVKTAIAGLNALRLINDTTATALSWESPKLTFRTLKTHPLRRASSSSKVLYTIDTSDIDCALQHFAKEFKTKYKIAVVSNPKATFRLAVGCERLKKVLSANTEAIKRRRRLFQTSRDEYEQLIALALERISGPLEQAFAESGLTGDQIGAVELIGGSNRIPAVRACIQAALGGKPLSTTFNQDEAISRGATFACAFFSPTFRVREFHMRDISHYPIQVCWERSEADPDEDTELTVFPRGNSVPSTKVLTFYRKGPFDIEARCLEPEGLPGRIHPWIATFFTKNVPAGPRGDLTCVKLKTRLNLHGIMSFDSAYVEEVDEREETAPMDVDGDAAPAEAPPKKRRVKKIDVPFTTLATSLDPVVLEKFKEQEAQMHAADKLVQDTEDRKNALEEYIYDTRGKLDDRYAPFVQPAEKTKLFGILQEGENWLYSEEGEDATKSAYVGKLDALKAVGDPIIARYREAEEYPRTIAELRTTLKEYMSQATSSDEKFAHLDPKDKNAVVEKCATIQKWLEVQIARQAERPKNQDGVLKPVDILKKKDAIIYFAIPILTKPKPKSVPPNGTQTPQSGTQTPDPGAKQEKTQQEAPPKAEEDVPRPPEMDVD
ncbi:Hsp70 protein-domain-containing protein [Melanogaster broomeanus]|nr:Hsp70 protein-domain-containing protein [Melanogaster broomeanus]